MKSLSQILTAPIPLAPSPCLDEILAGNTSISTSGYPIISEEAFALFLKSVPHLFGDGLTLLNWLREIQLLVEASPYPMGKDELSILRSIEVLKTVTRTANITAPTDLWLLRQVLSTYQESGVLEWMSQRKSFSTSELASSFQFNAKPLRFDLDLLLCRGYLKPINADTFQISDLPQCQDVFRKIRVLPESFGENWATLLQSIFDGSASTQDFAKADEFIHLPMTSNNRQGWTASLFEIEYGYRLVPLVLALRKVGITHKLTVGKSIAETLPDCPQAIEAFLKSGGLSHLTGEVSSLGARIFSRGPGPFGIIYAYLDYLHHHRHLLRGERKDVWVARGENVAASKDANAKTFALINESLDRFCQTHSFQFQVFIEHAVGYGEATRQRFQKDGESKIQYFGADLEDAAIDRALESQIKGELPRNMKFIRHADIGNPQQLIHGIEAAGFSVKNSVMVVGNGFHEIRNQTNDKMIEVFRAYKEAEILLIFTEESALTNEDLLETGWNTYHAGFRYTHAISGQELRPVYDADVTEDANPAFSWEKCVTRAGYKLLGEFSTHTRTIYPHRRANGRNPAISVNYFCVPKEMVLERDA